MSIASLLTLNITLIIASMTVAAFLIVFYRLHYVVDAVIFKRTDLIEMLDGCEVSGERATAVRRIGNRFCATAAALLEANSGEPIDRQRIESIIANTHCAFKFVMQVERLDINKLIDRLETDRNMREIELGRLNDSGSKGNAAKTGILKRQIEQLNHEIEKVSTGGMPLKVSQYIMTSSVSDSRFRAQESAKSQLRELSSEFGALLGSRAEILVGNDLVKLLKYDSTMMQ